LWFINLRDNKIKRVHPNVFDHLNELRILDINNNVCVAGNENNQTAVPELITKIKEQCNDIIPRTSKIQKNVTKASDQAKSQNENIKSLKEEALKIQEPNSTIVNITTESSAKNDNTMTKKLHLVKKYSILLMFIYSIFTSQ
jgi:hypothetical protein